MKVHLEEARVLNSTFEYQWIDGKFIIWTPGAHGGMGGGTYLELVFAGDDLAALKAALREA